MQCAGVLQVQKVLKNLTIEGGLQEDHLELLWNLTEKVRRLLSAHCFIPESGLGRLICLVQADSKRLGCH